MDTEIGSDQSVPTEEGSQSDSQRSVTNSPQRPKSMEAADLQGYFLKEKYSKKRRDG